MALNIGELELKIVANTEQLKEIQSNLTGLQNKTRNSSKGFSGLAGQIGLANKAIDLASQAISKLGSEVVRGIKLATDLGESTNKLKVTFSSVSQEAFKLRDNLTTSFGLSKIQATELLGATGDLLTGFGFTQEKALELSNQVQELSVDLASFQNLEGGAEQASIALTKALLGETESAKSLGIVIRQNTPEFREQVNTLMETQGVTVQVAKSQVILQEAMKQSKNALGDYERTTESLANRQRTLKNRTDDIITTFGANFLPVLNQITGEMLKSAEGIQKFLDTGKGAKQLQIALAGVSSTLFGIIKIIQLNFKLMFLPVRIFVTMTKAALQLLKPLDGVREGFTKIAEAVGNFFNQAFQKALDLLGGIIEKLQGMLKFFGIELPDALTNSITIITDDFKSFGGEVKNIISDVVDFTVEAFENIDEAVEPPLNDLGNKVEGAGENAGKKFGEGVGEGFKEVFMALVPEVLNAAGQIADNISEILTDQLDEQLNKLAEQHEMELELIDERLQKELELLENNGMTKEEMQQEELARLEAQLAATTNLKEQAVLNEQIAEINKAINIDKVNKAALKAREAEEKKFAKEQHKIAVEQFNIKKATDISNAGISFATGLIQAWGSAMAFPFPASIAIGAVLTGLLTGVFASSVATIASKQPPPPPKFATGGVAGGFGAKGPTDSISAQVSPGEMMLNGEQQRSLFNAITSGNIGGGAQQQIILMIDSEQIPINRMFVNNRQVGSLRSR
jgi:hypothetical protein